MDQPVTQPVTTKKSANNATFRAACLTIYQLEDITELPVLLQFLAFGKETCPTTGRGHLQAFAYAKNSMRLTQWKTIYPTAHIEEMRGSFKDNEAYCSKEGQYTKMGKEPMISGHKRILAQICDSLVENPRLPEQLAFEEPEARATVVQYTNGLYKLAQYSYGQTIKGDYTPPEVIYVWGPPGAGKTWIPRTDFDIYDVPAGSNYKWKTNYFGQPTVLYDNVTSDTINPTRFLKEIDRYPIQVETKGAFAWWKPRKIYITSVQSPDQFATAFEHPQEIHRRITSVQYISTPYQAPQDGLPSPCN